MLIRRRAATGPQIAAEADFHRNLPLYKGRHQLAVLPGVQAMANALGAKIDRAPHRFRPGCLAGVHREPQSVLAAAAVNLAKKLRRAAALIAANAKADDARALLTAAHSLFHHALCRIRPEVTHRVKDPKQRDAKIFLSTPAPGLDAAKNFAELLSAPVHNAYAHIHFCVQNVLRAQALHHAIGDELVIVGGPQALGDRLKGHEEPKEILVLIECPHLVFREHRQAFAGLLIFVS